MIVFVDNSIQSVVVKSVEPMKDIRRNDDKD